jgi:hypothetical protein
LDAGAIGFRIRFSSIRNGDDLLSHLGRRETARDAKAEDEITQRV